MFSEVLLWCCCSINYRFFFLFLPKRQKCFTLKANFSFLTISNQTVNTYSWVCLPVTTKKLLYEPQISSYNSQLRIYLEIRGALEDGSLEEKNPNTILVLKCIKWMLDKQNSLVIATCCYFRWCKRNCCSTHTLYLTTLLLILVIPLGLSINR